MLSIIVKGPEFWDEQAQEFVTKGDTVLHLEHSLASLSKWESIWEVPFLGKEQKTSEQILSYVECMAISPLASTDVFRQLSDSNLESINAYLESKQTATRINEIKQQAPSREIITAELIYYWMISYQIPFECQYWNLNTLFTLIRICGIKNSKPKKMSRSEMMQQQRQLNEQRRQSYGTRG